MVMMATNGHKCDGINETNPKFVNIFDVDTGNWFIVYQLSFMNWLWS